MKCHQKESWKIMLKEIVTTGKTIEEAVAKACDQLHARQEDCTVEILEKPKKSFFGKVKIEAKVRVVVKETVKQPSVATPVTTPQPEVQPQVQPESKVQTEVQPEPEIQPEVQSESQIKSESQVQTQPEVQQEVEQQPEVDATKQKLQAATTYLKDVLDQMGLAQVQIQTQIKENSAVLTLVGENLGVLIGRHGETLDSLQYLTSLVCNRVEGDYFRITLDCSNYREKREEALKELAKKISMKVRRTGRSQMLEPMNPYERRIIHAVLSDIEGVTSKSKGDEPNRRVVILPSGYHKNNYRSKNKPYPKKQPERTMEQILKGDFTETEKNTKRYSKIEL